MSRRRFGPGMLVAAAFVGPGTVTTASSAGAGFGYALAWALLFSVLATIVLQEMAVRQALVTRQPLAASLRRALGDSWGGRFAVLLVIAAVGLGNAAYESGNIAGAAVALSALGNGDAAGISSWSLAIGALAAALLFLPGYQYLERLLITLVLAMSVIFAVSALLLRPDWGSLARGLLQPRLPGGGLTMVIALIGTTVVPYNLFLQANAVCEKWSRAVPLGAALSAARADTALSVALGGLITLAIVSTSASVYFGSGGGINATQLAAQLEPALGPAGRYLFAAGLFAAGLTSAVTAPLAAAYAVCGALGWQDTLRGARFRLVAIAVIATGTLFAATGTRPVAAIVFAQAANGLLLPFVAIALLWSMNRADLLGDTRNGWVANLFGLLVVAVTIGLGGAKIVAVFGT
jgi:manganese transport protein